MKKRIAMIIVVVLSLLGGILAIPPASAETCFEENGQCPSPPDCPLNPDPQTPGYWKNHSDEWRYCFTNNTTTLDEINVCCTTCADCGCTGCTTLSKAEALDLLWSPIAGDKSYTMLEALIAAKLNRLAGADVSCINMKINAAAYWYCQHPVGSGVTASSSAWKLNGEALYNALDYYNNYGCPLP